MMMKQNKPIPKVSDKIKRGTPFTVKATGEEGKFHILRPDGRYLIWFPESEDYRDFSKEELKEFNAPRASIRQVVKPVSDEEKKRRNDLNVFFASQALQIPDRCENCGERLHATDHLERRAMIAHILPKSPNSGFPEVAIHPQNKMFLGPRCGCHPAWDNGDSNDRKKMACYSIALERFELFKHLIPDNKLPKAYTYLGIKWQ